MIDQLTPYPHCKAAYQYAIEVIAGEIPACVHVRNACQRFLDDLERDNFPYYFDVEKGERAVKFIETLPHTKGKWLTQKKLLKLQPWQKFIVVNIFGWVDDEGLRRFNEAYISVPRKNGKSALAAGIGVFMLAADGEASAEVYCGATTEKQAWEVFKPAKTMVSKLEALREAYSLEVCAKRIINNDDGGVFAPVIGNPGDGSSPHLWIVDEYHEHKDNSQVNTALTGMMARENPLLLMITTAGSDISSPCYDKEKYLHAVLAGQLKSDATERVFGIIYTLDKLDDWKEPSVLIKANPNYGISAFEKNLTTQLKKAIDKTSEQNPFKIKHLNQWVNAKETWLNYVVWESYGDANLSESNYCHLDCVCSLDLASKIDICAFVRVYYENKSNGRHYYIFGDYFLPEDRITEEEANYSYDQWVLDGYLTISGEHEILFSEVEDRIKEFLEMGTVKELVYDPYKSTHLAQNLEKDSGIDIVEFKQNAIQYTAPMQEFEAALAGGRIHHDNNPILNWMVSNAVKGTYKTDYSFILKEKHHQKIDGVVAMVMGVGRAMYDKEDDRHVYDIRDVRQL